MDPKGAAKAAKAYAKATRPWYKKKRWIGANAIAAIAGMAATSGGDTGTQPTDGDDVKTAASQPEAGSKAAKDAKAAAPKSEAPRRTTLPRVPVPSRGATGKSRAVSRSRTAASTATTSLPE
jgi:hypothetical protein